MRKVILLIVVMTLFAIEAVYSQTYWDPSGSNIFNNNLGNVGIGTNAPSNKLHVLSNSAGTWCTFLNNSNTSGLGLRVKAGSSTTTNAIFQLEDFSGNVRFKVLGNGNVGIGLATPLTRLHINSTNTETNSIRMTKITGDGLLAPIKYNHWDFENSGSSLIYKYNQSVSETPGTFTNLFTFESSGTFEANSLKTDNVLGKTGLLKLGGTTTIPAISILSNGNVGIGTGTTNPTNKMDIIQNSSTNWGAYIYNSNSDGKGLKVKSGYFSVNTGTILQLEDVESTVRFKVLSNGNVGIGTATPEKNLDVVGNVRIRTSMNNDLFDVVNDASANTVDANYALIWGRYTNLQGSNPSLISFTTWDIGSYRHIFTVNNNGDMTLTHKSNGNYNYAFKVRVDNPSTKAIALLNPVTGHDDFMVNGEGKVWCREVTVSLDEWKDVVFEPDYDLLSLKDVEQFIKENGRLPEIPSTSEMIENGLQTSEMIKLQMQKIEELTLYVIEQQKAIDELKNEVNQLKNK